MDIMVKSSNGVTTVSLETKLLSARKIFLTGEIDYAAAIRFAQQISYLKLENATESVSVFINSVGGDINSGLLLYDIIQTSAIPLNLVCTGKAYSMAGILLASGEKGRRYILPHSEVMLHEPLIGSRIHGSSSSIKTISDNLLETKKLMNRLLMKHTGKTEKVIEKATSYDHYFTAEESVAFGLCDRIISADEFF